MSKLLIYIGENKYFDPVETSAIISSMEGISEVQNRSTIGAIFDCKYTHKNRSTIVRITDKLKTVTVEGLGPESFDFAIKFQERVMIALHAIDLEYSFDVVLQQFGTVDELMAAAGC